VNSLFQPNKKKRAEGTTGDFSWLKPVFLIIVAGGLLGAIVAFFLQRRELALGILVGSLLSIINFHLLHSLTDKVVKVGDRGRGIFWFWTLIRWAVAAILCWGLLKISYICLLGALGGYFWALLVLGWMGFREAKASAVS
jgi:hypothetical protein